MQTVWWCQTRIAGGRWNDPAAGFVRNACHGVDPHDLHLCSCTLQRGHALSGPWCAAMARHWVITAMCAHTAASGGGIRAHCCAAAWRGGASMRAPRARRAQSPRHVCAWTWFLAGGRLGAARRRDRSACWCAAIAAGGMRRPPRRTNGLCRSCAAFFSPCSVKKSPGAAVPQTGGARHAGPAPRAMRRAAPRTDVARRTRGNEAARAASCAPNAASCAPQTSHASCRLRGAAATDAGAQ